MTAVVRVMPVTLRTRGQSLALSLSLPLAVAAWVLWPMRRASFAMIDDHHIADAVGTRDRLHVGEWWTTWWSKSGEQNGRFRPGYWLAQTLEMSAWGRHPGLWYGGRVLLAAITITAVVVASSAAPLVARWLAGTVVVAGPWSEIWFRLGPNEAYAVPLTAAAVAWWVVRPGIGVAGNVGPLVLLVAAGLVKESFLPLAVLAALGLAVVGQRRDRREGVAFASVLACCVVAGLASVWKVLRYGQVYGDERSISTAVDSARWLLEQTIEATGWALVLLALALTSSRRSWLVVAVVFGAVVGSQALVYAGQPYAPRYLMPTALLASVAFGLVRRFTPLLVVVLAATSWLLWTAAGSARSDAAAWAKRTLAFQSSLDRLADEPGQVVFVTGDYWAHLEPIVATVSFLRAEGHDPGFAVVGIDDTGPVLGALQLDAEPSTNCIAVTFWPVEQSVCERAIVVAGL
jgi:hypothetical protein